MTSYIYIGIDLEKPQLVKIGSTKRKPRKRETETTNPFYKHKKTFSLRCNDPLPIEKKIQNIMEKSGFKRVPHAATGNTSEWFYCTFDKADKLVSDYIMSIDLEFQKQENKRREEARLRSEYLKQQQYLSNQKRNFLTEYESYFTLLKTKLSEFEKLKNDVKVELESNITSYSFDYKGLFGTLFNSILITSFWCWLLDGFGGVSLTYIATPLFLFSFYIFKKDMKFLQKVPVKSVINPFLDEWDRKYRPNKIYSDFLTLSKKLDSFESIEAYKSMENIELPTPRRLRPLEIEELNIKQIKEEYSLSTGNLISLEGLPELITLFLVCFMGFILIVELLDRFL